MQNSTCICLFLLCSCGFIRKLDPESVCTQRNGFWESQTKTCQEVQKDVVANLIYLERPKTPVSEETSTALRLGQVFWEGFAQTCEGHPSKFGCDDGDMVLFNGLLCGAGIGAGCSAVQAAQGDDGRIWRSPRRIDGETVVGHETTFSRDMAYGVFVYLVKTRDTILAKKWMQWILKSQTCLYQVEGTCLRQRKVLGAPIITIPFVYTYCSDREDKSVDMMGEAVMASVPIDRCIVDPASWNIIGKVWDHLKLDRESPMNDNKFLDDPILRDFIEKTYPQYAVGFRVHLAQIALWIEHLIGKRNESSIAALTHGRLNLFARYLRFGPHQDLALDLLRLCPASEDGPYAGKG